MPCAIGLPQLVSYMTILCAQDKASNKSKLRPRSVYAVSSTTAADCTARVIDRRDMEEVNGAAADVAVAEVVTVDIAEATVDVTEATVDVVEASVDVTKATVNVAGAIFVAVAGTEAVSVAVSVTDADTEQGDGSTAATAQLLMVVSGVSAAAADTAVVVGTTTASAIIGDVMLAPSLDSCVEVPVCHNKQPIKAAAVHPPAWSVDTCVEVPVCHNKQVVKVM